MSQESLELRVVSSHGTFKVQVDATVNMESKIGHVTIVDWNESEINEGHQI